MKLERAYRDLWAMPPACSVCGEPRTDGKPYVASVTLDKKTKWSGASAEVTTQLSSIPFPRCAKCVKATSRHGYAQGIAGVVGLLFGIVAISLGVQLSGWIWGCAAGLLVWIALAVALMKLAEWAFERSYDDDMRRRAQLPEQPVTIAKIGGTGTAAQIRFTFSNDEYGQTFADMNP